MALAGIRLVLLDDQILFRESLGSLLKSEADFEIAGQFGNVEEALAALGSRGADIVLVSSRAVGELVAILKRAARPVKILMISERAGREEAVRALKWGAAGVIAHDTPPGCLALAVRAVAHGNVWFGYDVVESLAEAYFGPGGIPGEEFTERHRQVLQGICDGLTNRSIAERLGITEGAVKAAVRYLMRKLAVRTRGQLVGSVLNRGNEAGR